MRGREGQVTSQPDNVSDPLEFLAAQALADITSAYKLEFALELARAKVSEDPVRIAAANEVIRKLRLKHDSFRVTDLNDLIKSQRVRALSEKADADNKTRPPIDVSTCPLIFFGLNDDGNAERLLALHRDKMRYCPEFKAWLIWDGRRWEQDKFGKAQELAVDAMRKFLSQVRDDGKIYEFALKSVNLKGVTNCLALAAPRVAVSAGKLDSSPWLFNFRNGTVDLRTGAMKPHDPADLITKLADHDYNLKAECPRWREFVNWTMGGGSESDADRVGRFTEYLQRALGYSITGSTSEKALFIPWGEKGNNGKTTMLVVVGRLIPEYSGMLDVETLMTRSRSSSNASADIADLRGVRFVRTSEAETTQRLAQGLVKKLTEGQGEVKAIKKYENWVSFAATHKIWMDTNGRPSFEAEDNAMMNRMHLIPFPASLAESDVDRTLPDALVRDEACGILAWLVRGAVKWYKDRLRRPDEAVAARDQWRDQMEVDDPWMTVISDWIVAEEMKFMETSRSFGADSFFDFTVAEILSGPLKIPPKDQDGHGKADTMRVGKILGRFKSADDKPQFERYRRPAAPRLWAYRRINPAPDSA